MKYENYVAGALLSMLLVSALALAACSDSDSSANEDDAVDTDGDPAKDGKGESPRDGGKLDGAASRARDAAVEGGRNPRRDAQSPPAQDEGNGEDGDDDDGEDDDGPSLDSSTARVDSGNRASDASMVPDAGPSTAHDDLGKGDGQDVIAIGDSWMSLGSTGIQQSLVRISGQRYRTYGVGGTQLLNGQIPGQYDRAKSADPDIKTVVMTGGGNDLLALGTSERNPCADRCKAQIDKVGVRLSELWAQMDKDGVEDLIYVQYSRGGSNKSSVDYATSVVRPRCEAAPLRCHYIDSDDMIMMQLADGIHPTAAGCDQIGKAVFELMEKEGMRR